ncbi:MAG TPA: hypothetical protein DEG17_23725, partial [Cyanobacteria bacterium UBA11149]|nr:hypothetical protein [Cyanobacteria bacterium UBA11367]HBE58532.1 hypothetical protein [Cyanobacteria bacterium UBA11366]HBR72429.1 hypothetical protein [Cyanobacteria bacterium UBA11159]HBW91792.1 hypothetical protein [Cyanobacteria bacterium UBA11149]
DVAVAIYLSKGEGLGCYIGFFQEWTVDTGELLRLPDCQLSALRDVIDVNTDMAVAIQTGCNWCKL